METTTIFRPATKITSLGLLIVLETMVFLLAGFLHTGIVMPLGFAVLREPQIIPATIVEGLCGLFLGVSAYGVLTRRPWARRTALAAHFFAFGGVVLGMTALALGAGPRTMTNDLYHIIMLVSLVASFVLLQISRVKLSIEPSKNKWKDKT